MKINPYSYTIIDCVRGTLNCHQYCSDTVECCPIGYVGGDGDSCIGESHDINCPGDDACAIN